MKKVILGYLGEEIITQDEEDPFCSKIGGKPVKNNIFFYLFILY